ncbi:nuclear transport factor 2 family protein [Rhizorhapis suberifaciens]|uniref:SnoaL-like domain-containing protein n=1 Tax=Rhizorhapis suberifaciens TaxID=13656 RepID=A0A840HX05_9SPHN|nr:nuclear transport factor 2 family protein [Rhizorhapis suberifaciens]MBB4642181.1 hypothetical protein [Rhizorhapis suberifaciens]
MTTDMTDNAQELHDLVQKNKIHENLMKYCRGQDRKDLELMKSSYWPDAIDNHGSFVGNAHEFCEMAYEGQKKSGHSALHHCSNVLIELSGDQAKCESAFLYVMSHPGKKTQFLGGRYRDLCEKRDGEWKVLRRMCIFDWANELDGAQDFQTIFKFPQDTVVGRTYPNDPIYAEW